VFSKGGAAKFYQDPNFPDRRQARENAERAMVLDTSARLQTRFALQTLLLQCMQEQRLDALVAPMSTVPPRKLTAPREPTANGRSPIGWSLLGQQGFAAWVKVYGSESQSKVQTERDWCRRGTIRRPIETDWQHRLNEVSLEQAVRDWPTVVHQGSESPLRRIDVKRRSYSHAEVVPHVPHQPRMYGEIGLSRSALHSRNQFEIVGHAPVSLEGNSKRKANGKFISDVSSLASRMGDQREHKTDMSAQSRLSVCCRNS